MDDIDYLKTLVESMPRRLQDVIDREGATTKYYKVYSTYVRPC
jgi:hypothetical protein